MNEMLTVNQNFDTPIFDKMKNRSKRQKTKNRKPFSERKVPFEVNAAWKKCLGGREEYAHV